jgi:hypothetical protein
MDYDHSSDAWFCASCGSRVTSEAIQMSAAPAYRPSMDPLVAGMQALMDYEIEGVNRGDGRIAVEYPRPRR